MISMPLRRVTPAAVAVAVLLAGTACGEARPTIGDGPYAELVGEFVPKIEQALGVPFKSPPVVESRTREEVAAFVRQQLDSDRAKAQLAGQESLYKILGIIPDTMQLAPMLQRLLEEQIVGYYDPKTKVLYIVDGSPSLMLRQTVSHELVHALQDQYLAIDSIQSATDDADRQLAAQAVIEGQAVFLQLRLDASAGPMLKMPGGWDRLRDMIREGSSGMPVFASAPRAVREGLLFPYMGGADFVRRFINIRPETALFADLPTSTKQLLHDSAYFASSRDEPTRVTLPEPRTGSVLFTNTFGEFETRLALVQHLKADARANDGASGVDGDRVALIRTPAGDAVVWASVWDSSVDAADFLDAVIDAIRRRYEMAKPDVAPGATERRLDVAAGTRWKARTVTVSLREVGGRPVVVVTDAPAGVPLPLVDPGRVTLGR
jgi:hypothetical protein